MKNVALVLAAGVALFAASAHAQQPRTTKKGADPKPPLEDVSSMAQMTPEMWFYIQESHRYDDPKEMVRRKAEFKAVQRQRRIAAMQWYGFSNSRPTANTGLFEGSYSPCWGANNRSNPSLWPGPRGGVFYNAQVTGPGFGLW
jgi:hypothetical protein